MTEVGVMRSDLDFFFKEKVTHDLTHRSNIPWASVISMGGYLCSTFSWICSPVVLERQCAHHSSKNYKLNCGTLGNSAQVQTYVLVCFSLG